MPSDAPNASQQSQWAPALCSAALNYGSNLAFGGDVRAAVVALKNAAIEFANREFLAGVPRAAPKDLRLARVLAVLDEQSDLDGHVRAFEEMLDTVNWGMVDLDVAKQVIALLFAPSEQADIPISGDALFDGHRRDAIVKVADAIHLEHCTCLTPCQMAAAPAGPAELSDVPVQDDIADDNEPAPNGAHCRGDDHPTHGGLINALEGAISAIESGHVADGATLAAMAVEPHLDPKKTRMTLTIAPPECTFADDSDPRLAYILSAIDRMLFGRDPCALHKLVGLLDFGADWEPEQIKPVLRSMLTNMPPSMLDDAVTVAASMVKEHNEIAEDCAREIAAKTSRSEAA